MLLNPELIKLARYALEHPEDFEVKDAFVPPDSAQGGAPPGGGPPQGGPPGAAPGGPPPGDPSAAGGAPPPGGDPSGGAPPPPNPGMDPTAIQMMIDQGIQKALANQGGGMGGAGGAGAAAGKPAKMDPMHASMDAFHTKKLMEGLYHAMNLPLPQGILDGPNRDPSTGLPLPAGTPSPMSQGPSAQGQPQNAIKPLDQLQPAMLGGGGAPAGKAASVDLAPSLGRPSDDGPPKLTDLPSRAAAASAILRSLRK